MHSGKVASSQLSDLVARVSSIPERLDNISHGMLRLLPWSSGIGGNKVTAEDFKMLVAPTQHQSTVLDPASLHMLKRKRADSHDSIAIVDAPPMTKRCLEQHNEAPTMDVHVDNVGTTNADPGTNRNNNNNMTESDSAGNVIQDSHGAAPQNDMPARQRTKMDRDSLRQTLDAQLSLEILLKHNELRLIDQEIAKCQVALEQLRRCAEIPYPLSNSSGLSQTASSGTGFAIPFAGSGPAPVSPAPWGVTDGPYSRHYAKWLLPDPTFDGGDVESTAYLSGYASQDGRATRGSVMDHNYVAGKSRAQRGSLNTKLQALPSGYSAPKDKAGPMIIKRKSDGQYVKLVCLDCRRFDFSSTQGFINHCRIAHSRTFASHDAAAAASGEPVEVDEAGAVVGGHTEAPSTAAPGYVHPLIRSAHTIETPPKANSQQPSVSATTPSNGTQVGQSTATEMESPRKKRNRSGTPDPAFKASPDTPHLSSLLAGRGLRLDLREIVGDAKVTIDFDQFSSDEESHDELEGIIEPSQDRPQLSVRGSRLPTRTTMPQAASERPTSSKGPEMLRSSNKPCPLDISTPAQQTSYISPYGSPPTSVGGSHLHRAPDVDMVDSGENLSPHTVESNQAPSLVSDDDDEYEAISDAESLSPSSSEADGDGEEPDDIEVEDDEGTVTSTTTDTKTDHDLASSARLKRGHGKKKDRVLTPTIVSLNRGKDGKRVSFVTTHSPPAKAKRNTTPKPHR